MSERDRDESLHAEDLDDWVVLDSGVTAVFHVGSLDEAAYRAAAIAKVPGLERSGAVLIIATDRLTVLLTRGVPQSGPPNSELACAISAVARSWGLVVDRDRAQEVQFAMESSVPRT